MVIRFLFTFSDFIGQVRFHAVRQFSAGQHHAVSAGFTFQPNICAQPDDLPGVTAAWMRFSQPDPVPEVKFLKHAAIITHVIISQFITTGWA